MLNLFTREPERLSPGVETDALLAAIQALTVWDELALANADYWFAHLTARNIARANDAPAIAELQRTLTYCTKVSALRSQLGEYAARWSALNYALESRRMQVKYHAPSDHGFVERLLKKAHVRTILLSLAVRPRMQKELADECGVTAARISQLCGELELARLINRELAGASQFASLTDVGRGHLPKPKPAPVNQVSRAPRRAALRLVTPPTPLAA
jgi:DNA-binding MarR family transcriptional regulator